MEEGSNSQSDEYYDEENSEMISEASELSQQLLQQQSQLKLDNFNKLMAQTKSLDKKQVQELLDLIKESPQQINQILAASFQANALKKKAGLKAKVTTMLSSFLGQKKDESLDNVRIEFYFELLKNLIYGNANWQSVVRQIQKGSKGMGVCAKVLKAGDVAWKCEDCEKDSTCIICQECFEKSNHKGHRVWLKTNVGGCCDCGDPDAWDEHGFCSDHRGFAASSEAMLSQLPKQVRDNSPIVFSSLAKSLKGVLLDLITGKDKDELQKVVAKIFFFYEQCCDESPSNIYFISQSLLLIFQHEFLASKGHTCCYRYFVSEDKRVAFGNETQKKDSTDEWMVVDQVQEYGSFLEEIKSEQQNESGPEKIVNVKANASKCTCSVLDLICQTNYNLERVTTKQITNLFFKMFQSYEFKLHLGLSYVANFKELSDFTNSNDGILNLGVQLLTIDDIILQALKDPILCQNFTKVLDYRLSKIIESQTREHFLRLSYLAHDVKYMCKPLVAPIVIRQTEFVPQLLTMLKQLHFADSVTQPTAMPEYSNDTKFELIQAELDLMSKIERYLQYVIHEQDVQKVLNTFFALFESLSEQLESFKGKGFFLMPIHRLFSYLITRVMLKAYIESQDANLFSFYHALSQFLTPVQIQTLTTQVMKFMAIHQGFIAEIRSRKWIYKGEEFQRLPLIKLSVFKDYFLNDLSLMQMMTVASQRPSDAIDILIKNFGTDDWLGFLQTQITAEQLNGDQIVPGSAGFSLKESLFAVMPRFDVIKLSSQVRLLFLQLIQMSIYESSFLHSLKNLFTIEEQNETGKEAALKEKSEKMFAGHLKRVLMHHLFLLGASSNIDAIKKSMDPLFIKSDHFMTTLIEISDKSTDADGKIRFRLKEDNALLATFDPFFIVQEQHQSMQQAAYESLHKKRTCLNNIVGDYQHNYKYQTSINKVIQTAIANSSQVVKLVASVLKLCFEVAIGSQQQDKEFHEKLFNTSLMNAALKLQLIISELSSDSDLIAFVRRNLSLELISKIIQKVKADAQLEKILQHLLKLVHPPTQEGVQEETKHDGQAALMKESAEAKKAAIAEKKRQMMEKMKQKQTKFIDKKVQQPTAEMEVDQVSNQQTKETPKIQCAACQEACEMHEYWKKPFVQLGYASSSKILYHSYRQTCDSQKQSLRNQKAATQGHSLNTHIQHDPDEETKEAPNQTNEKADDWKDAETELVVEKLGLKGVIDSKLHTGVQVSKCCHYFHYECLQSYLTSETTQQTYAQIRMRNVVGIDEGTIQCPICKALKNTWFPFLPLRESQDSQNRAELELYVTFLNQLIQTHFANKDHNRDPSKGLPKDIMLVDVEKDPVKIVSHVMKAFSHLLLTLSSVRCDHLWTNFDPQVQSDDVCLRDLVLIVLSTRRIIKSINFPLNELIENLLQMVQADQLCEEESFYGKNYSKTIIKLVFAICMVIDSSHESELLIDAVFQSIFASLKTATTIGQIFRKGFGEVSIQNLKASLLKATQMDEDMIQSSLQFMRTAAACMLIVKAVTKNCSLAKIQTQEDLNITSTFMPDQQLNTGKGESVADELQCGLDVEFMACIRHQVDDLKEFEMLAQYLKFNQTLQDNQQIPKALIDLELLLTESKESGIKPFIDAICVESIRSAAGLDLQVDEMIDDYVKQVGTGEVLPMPENLHLLTPYYSFNFIELPGDYQKLVKDYYNRKCRYCKTQVQKNAICLLCGEVLCLQMKDGCCYGQPGSLNFQSQMSFFGPASEKQEGELSYHARMAEGGCSIFLVPSTAEVYIVDQGRISKFDSFYRNALGETFSEHSTKKWENYFLDAKTGGTRILENLKKLYVANKIGQKVMELRTKHDSVILRHVL